MRLWHKDLIKFLPDAQLKGQWRECALIAYGLQKNGTPNHLLVNRVIEYSYDEFATYCRKVQDEMVDRGFSTLKSIDKIYYAPWHHIHERPIFDGWHNKEYLRVCVCNLYEKYRFGVGKSKISQTEWDRILQGYKEITGEDWKL